MATGLSRVHPICLITSMITDQFGQPEVLSPICDILGFLKIKIQEIPRDIFARREISHLTASARWRGLSYCTVLLPIEIRTVESQSDLLL